MKKVRPFLKWAGGKYSCLGHILPSFAQAKRLIEPFTGSGVVFMNTDYPKYLLAEENQDLISLFQILQQEGTLFIDYCESFFNPTNNIKSQYYQLREEFNQDVNPRHRAALFLYLNRHGYNGLCRYNSHGGYNVPFGRYQKPYFPRQEMELFYQKSQTATFLHGDFRETFAKAQVGDFIYCDPPYAPIDQESNFSSYTQRKFGEKEHIALVSAARAAAVQGIPVVISNHDTKYTRHYYEGATIISFQVSRFINSDSSHRVPVRELIAIF